MPLTDFQAALAKRLSVNRSEDSYLAGGAALHFAPNTQRYSNDLDYFHDSVERVASAFATDQQLLENEGYTVTVDVAQPGYVRAVVQSEAGASKVEWAHDSAWRFMPTIRSESIGFVLDPIDLATNKLLALAGRDEARDFFDVLHIHEHVLALGALCWATVGKDPGFTPLSLLELLKRRGKYQPDDFRRLQVTTPIDVPLLKTTWLAALDSAAAFIESRPPEEIGCLYYSKSQKKFVAPRETDEVVCHYGRPGGVLPSLG